MITTSEKAKASTTLDPNAADALTIDSLCRPWDGQQVWAVIDKNEDMWRQAVVLAACPPISKDVTNDSWNFVLYTKHDSWRHVMKSDPVSDDASVVQFNDIQFTEIVDFDQPDTLDKFGLSKALYLPTDCEEVPIRRGKVPVHPYILEELRALRLQVQTLQNETGPLKQRVADLEKENQRLRDEEATYLATRDGLESAKKALIAAEQSNAVLKVTAEEKGNEIEFLRKKVDELIPDIEELRNKYNNHRKIVNEMQNDLNTETAKNEFLASTILGLEDQLSSRSAEVNNLKMQLKDFEDLKAANEELAKRIVQVELERPKVNENDEKLVLLHEIKRLNTSIATLSQHNDVENLRVAKLAQLEKELLVAQQKIQELERDKSRLEDDVNVLRSSSFVANNKGPVASSDDVLLLNEDNNSNINDDNNSTASKRSNNNKENKKQNNDNNNNNNNNNNVNESIVNALQQENTQLKNDLTAMKAEMETLEFAEQNDASKIELLIRDSNLLSRNCSSMEKRLEDYLILAENTLANRSKLQKLNENQAMTSEEMDETAAMKLMNNNNNPNNNESGDEDDNNTTTAMDQSSLGINWKKKFIAVLRRAKHRRVVVDETTRRLMQLRHRLDNIDSILSEPDTFPEDLPFPAEPLGAVNQPTNTSSLSLSNNTQPPLMALGESLKDSQNNNNNNNNNTPPTSGCFPWMSSSSNVANSAVYKKQRDEINRLNLARNNLELEIARLRSQQTPNKASREEVKLLNQEMKDVDKRVKDLLDKLMELSDVNNNNNNSTNNNNNNNKNNNKQQSKPVWVTPTMVITVSSENRELLSKLNTAYEERATQRSEFEDLMKQVTQENDRLRLAVQQLKDQNKQAAASQEAKSNNSWW